MGIVTEKGSEIEGIAIGPFAITAGRLVDKGSGQATAAQVVSIANKFNGIAAAGPMAGRQDQEKLSESGDRFNAISQSFGIKFKAAHNLHDLCDIPTTMLETPSEQRALMNSHVDLLKVCSFKIRWFILIRNLKLCKTLLWSHALCHTGIPSKKSKCSNIALVRECCY